MSKPRDRHDLHHAFPRSRFPEYASEGWNIRSVRIRRHGAYHTLFENRTPCEAAMLLLREFGPVDPGDLEADPGYLDLLGLLERIGW
ncbi:MAG: hypothetical protein WC763_05260 [Candidatus Paceibacterota bacterium]|jgi:hypothetical protein